jgi:catechol 2,3-dioxygenase-like lactoylglutathione lyase family enzyme
MGVLDHVRVMTTDIERSRVFYRRVLGVLGYRVWHERPPNLVGLGPSSATEEPLATFWLREGDAPSTGTLVSFTVQSRELVERFHGNALEAGGTDGGEPATRPFHAHYYSAYVIDPDGVTLEVVCHHPEREG